MNLVYSIVYLLGSYSLHLVGSEVRVLAAQVDPTQQRIDQEERYRLTSRVDVDHTLIDGLLVKLAAIEVHLENSDKIAVDQGERLATITGVGGTVMALLGVLNLLGFIRPVGPRRR